MASSYFKLRLLKRRKEESKLIKNEGTKCRICLLKGSISIIHDLPREILLSIKLLGGIDVNENDEFPKHICSSCYLLLQNAILFRQKAENTDLILKKRFVVHSPKDLDIEESIVNDDNYEPFENYVKEKEAKCKANNESKDLIIHKSSNPHKDTRIQCSICNSVVTTHLYKRHLARHQSTSHLICEVCGKMFRKDNLMRHLQLHTYDLPFQCKQCPYRGRFLESLKIHMRTHSNKKPFVCDNCQLRFSTKSNLNRHLLSHKKEKPFTCNECHRGFYTKRDMEVHITCDHTGAKDFVCNICNNKYGNRKALMRHELRVHKRDKLAKGRKPLYLQEEFKKRTEEKLQQTEDESISK